MADMITIDASALSSIDYKQYLYDYFATSAVGATAGASTYYGGNYQSPYGYFNGSQVGFRYAGTGNNAQVVIDGANLAYDGLLGSTYGHGISGSISSITLGAYDSGTTYTQDDSAGTRSELTGVLQGLLISGLDYSAAIGAGTGESNLVYQIYNALRKANSTLDFDGDGDSGYEYIDYLYDLLGKQAQHFIGSAGNDIYTGTANADLIEGNDGADVLNGGDGADTITGGAGADTLNGGAGADRMTGGAGDDSYVIDDLKDVVIEDANGGEDTVTTTVSHYKMAANVEKLILGAGVSFGYGNDAANTIEGNDDANSVYAYGGDDTVNGGGGNDTLDGGAGADVLDGGIGADKLSGGDGADTLKGGDGNDSLNGGAGADTMVGGLGDDSYVIDDLKDVVTEGAKGGTDTVTTTVNHYQMAANIEKLVLSGVAYGYGNDSANTIVGNDAANSIYAYAGNDTVSGGAGNDVLDGGAGADVLDGGTGSDKLAGGEGNDTLKGGDGNDTLNGGVGSDTLIGGLGNDSYVVDSLKDVVTEAAKGGTDTVTATVNKYHLAANVEKLVLSGSAAVYGYGNDAGNTITGSSIGNRLYGEAGADTISGGAGNDKLFGGAGNDVLAGGSGADVLTGGAGIDTLTGNSGADTFVFALGDSAASRSKADTITDFNGKQGDIIDLSSIDANENKKGNQAFSFIGDDAFSHHAGELRAYVAGGEHYIAGDTDGDGKADFTIHFDNDVSFKAAYFDL